MNEKIKQNQNMAMQQNNKKYKCLLCNYNTSHKSHYTKHLESIKHKTAQMIKNDNTLAKSAVQWRCNCGKSYKFQSGFSRHKKTCTYKKEEAEKRSEIQALK